MQWDVAVVGSGLCGTLAAGECARRGLEVVVLEAGPPLARRLPADLGTFQKSTAGALKVDPKAWAYKGPKTFDWYRVRARGGRTLLWGGWMARPSPEYFVARRRAGAPWPREFERLEPYVKRAEQALKVKTLPAKPLHARLEALELCVSPKHQSMLRRGARPLTAADLPLGHLRTGAVVTHLEPSDGGLTVQLANGPEVRARRVVLAASPVETARIACASGVGGARFPLSDHLIAGAMALTDRAPASYETSALVFPTDPKLRYSIEVRGPKPLESLDDEDLGNLGLTRAQAKRRSFYVVFAMGETDPAAPREVELLRARDGYGRRVPRFLARPHTAYEKALAGRMNEACLGLARALASSAESAFPIYDAFDFASGGHEVGTCLELADRRGELSALPGVYLADGSAVPGATDRHPSLLLAANALRVTDALVDSLASRKRAAA